MSQKAEYSLYALVALGLVTLMLYMNEDRPFRSPFKKSKGRTGKGAKAKLKSKRAWKPRGNRAKSMIPSI